MDVNVAELRRRLAAPNRPDEGMRGTIADKVRQGLVCQSDVFHCLATLLLSGNDQEIEDSAAAIRSCLMGPAEGHAIGDIIAAPLCNALQRAVSPDSHCWVLWAMVRLAQFRECQGRLLHAGAVAILIETWKGTSETCLGHYGGNPCGTARCDIVTCHILAFLSETGGISVASQVPLAAIESFVLALDTRLSIAKEFSEPGKDTECTEAEELVKVRGFYGCPLYYRPRFILQALQSLAVASDEHAGAMWVSNLPPILTSILEGSLPNDSVDNKPYGSPDAVEVCLSLARTLMSYPDSAASNSRSGLSQALEAVSLQE